MRRSYSVGGWHVRSQFALPALECQAAGEPDIEIRQVGDRPRIAAPMETGENWAVGARQWLVWSGDNLCAYAEDGCRIDLWADGLPIEYTLEILPSAAFAAICYQRGKTPLHASAIAIGNAAILVMGQSGAGKSSTAAALLARGHRLLADDIALAACRGNGAFIAPVFPRLRAFPDVLDHFGLGGEMLADGKRRLAAAPGLTPAPVALAGVVVLGPRSAAPGKLEKLNGLAALQLLLDNRFAPQCAPWYGTERANFQDCSQLVRRVPVYAASAPDGFAHLPDFCARLEALAR